MKEYFIVFLQTCETTGEGLTKVILDELRKLDILVEDCRGQGYDNGSNMKGKVSGVQSRIKNIEPRAFYVPCAAHSLNLVVSDAASCSNIAVSFFGLVESIYVFFSASTHRWAVLKKHLSNLTLKWLSCTRWSSRIDAMKPICTNLEQIYEAQVELLGQGDVLSRHTAVSLGEKITKYEFICSAVIWFDILNKINIASRYFQTADISLSTAVEV